MADTKRTLAEVLKLLGDAEPSEETMATTIIDRVLEALPSGTRKRIVEALAVRLGVSTTVFVDRPYAVPRFYPWPGVPYSNEPMWVSGTWDVTPVDGVNVVCTNESPAARIT
jgi:hypothetical protein